MDRFSNSIYCVRMHDREAKHPVFAARTNRILHIQHIPFFALYVSILSCLLSAYTFRLLPAGALYFLSDVLTILLITYYVNRFYMIFLFFLLPGFISCFQPAYRLLQAIYAKIQAKELTQQNKKNYNPNCWADADRISTQENPAIHSET